MKVLPCLVALSLAALVRADDVRLSAIVNPRQADNEHERPALNQNAKKHSLQIAGHAFADGVGTQVDNRVALELGGATRFRAAAGVDDATDVDATVHFEVQADGTTLWSGDVKKGEPAAAVDLDVRGKTELVLVAQDVGNAYTQALADWVNATLAFDGVKPKSIAPPAIDEPEYILTPATAPTPRINSPRVFGVRPGHPFLFQIAATGELPMRFAATDLPDGLKLDPTSGRITGRLAQPGTHLVSLRATNSRGTAESTLRIVGGETIALTPPMGWNSWNCWGTSVDQAKVLASAQAMVNRGLREHGWSYVNIDDTWQGKRIEPDHALVPNEKFPDLKGLANAVHAMGLKIGIYSTPWDTSYAGFAGGSSDNPDGTWSTALINDASGKRRRHNGRYSFADADAKQWAAWGIDYLKYDWNPRNSSPAEPSAAFQRNVATMADAMRASGRDMVYSYSNSMPFDEIARVANLLNAWRTTGDINDTWGRLRDIWFQQEKWRPYERPGHWNDPDMLVVGPVDVGSGKNIRPSRLTPDEQYTHLSLWCLWSAPLLIGCPLERADDFTISLLTNDEVLALDQDELGAPAERAIVDGRKQVYVKQLADGSHAIGLFNLAQHPQEVSATWAQLKLPPPMRIRDLWRQKDIPADAETISATVPRHGVFLIRVWDK